MPITVILPYRSREKQLDILLTKLMRPDRNIGHIVIAEQGNLAPFNRGAVKSAGFDAAVDLLKLQDSDTVCFHDVDVVPEDRFVDYPECLPNEIWHLYGHKHCLGGVVCVTVGDFKKMGKFAHWEGWGKEDTDLMQQAKRLQIHVNHTRFTDRFSPSASGFYELTGEGGRQTQEAMRKLLQEKVQANRSQPNVSLSRKPVFTWCCLAPTRQPNLAHVLLA